ncbi:hypothetical protein FQA39_LY11517 [Lamprigera yunnana]|nr:hypothetical protein FQA39_LY11517 [Lamprigera yunnana]
MNTIFIYGFILWNVVNFGNAIVSDCGSTLGSWTLVEVSSCKPDQDDRCTLHRNKNSTIKLTFSSNDYAETMSLHDKSDGSDIRFEEPDKEEIPGPPMVGDLGLVKIATKKTLIYYIAEIKTVSGENFEVSFLRKGNKFYYPEVEDILQNIIHFLILEEDVAQIKAVVHGVVMGVPVAFALPNSDACVKSNLVCPLKAGDTYTYIAELPILKSYPRLTVDVKWELRKITGETNTNKNETDTSDDIICVLIPSKIQ